MNIHSRLEHPEDSREFVTTEVEHFAINARLRGKGYGSKLLDYFVRSLDKIVLLEIDPITDNISEARLRFYQRCRFHENPHPHKHPVYRNAQQIAHQ